MQKPIWYLFSLLLVSNHIHGQKVSGKLKFEPGKIFHISIAIEDTITQQAGGKAIDFLMKGTAAHSYKIINTPGQDITLHHELQRFAFQFDGMGQTKSFDSENGKDMEGPFGKQFGELLEKSYDMVIDSKGKTLKADPEKMETFKQDESTIIMADMLKDLVSMVYPPQKGSNSFFKVLPDQEVGIGDTWTDSIHTENERSITVNTLTAITDTTIIVEFKTNAKTLVKSEIMGRESNTKLKSIISGKIILDKVTGIIREKTSMAESNGGTEVMGSTLPITGKMSIIIRVKEE